MDPTKLKNPGKIELSTPQRSEQAYLDKTIDSWLKNMAK